MRQCRFSVCVGHETYKHNMKNWCYILAVAHMQIKILLYNQERKRTQHST